MSSAIAVRGLEMTKSALLKIHTRSSRSLILAAAAPRLASRRRHRQAPVAAALLAVHET